MVIIPALSPKCLTSENPFYNCILIVDSFSKIPKLYGMERITNEEVMDKSYVFQDRFGKIEDF